MTLILQLRQYTNQQKELAMNYKPTPFNAAQWKKFRGLGAIELATSSTVANSAAYQIYSKTLTTPTVASRMQDWVSSLRAKKANKQ